jgi:predicted Zn finger-like uncharacterized protein
VSGISKQCPDCQTPIRASAKTLREAGGRVRCDVCDNDFITPEYLSEEEQVDQIEKPARLDIGNELVADRTEQDVEPENLEHVTAPYSEEEISMNQQIDEELLRATQKLEVFASASAEGQNISQLLDKDSPMAETIVMEGEMVSSTLQEEHRKSDSANSDVKIPGWMKDTYARTRVTIHDHSQFGDPPNDSSGTPPSDSSGTPSGNRSGYTLIASLVLIGLFLLWQSIN